MPEWTEHLRARLASLSLSPAREAEIIEEVSQHLDQRYEELRAGGTSDADARRLAIAELLDRDMLVNHLRSLRQAHSAPPITPGQFLLGDLLQDVHYAARMVWRQPGFAAAAVVTTYSWRRSSSDVQLTSPGYRSAASGRWSRARKPKTRVLSSVQSARPRIPGACLLSRSSASSRFRRRVLGRQRRW